MGLLTMHDAMGHILHCRSFLQAYIPPDKLKLEARAFAHTAISSFGELISYTPC
jgi:hypothetical protein